MKREEDEAKDLEYCMKGTAIYLRAGRRSRFDKEVGKCMSDAGNM